MKNNDEKGLYEIGEKSPLICGCIIEADAIGYTMYIHPDCPLDNKYHSPVRGFQYKTLVK